MSENVMTQSKRLAHAFINSKEGFELVNVKFFMGDDRNVSVNGG